MKKLLQIALILLITLPSTLLTSCGESQQASVPTATVSATRWAQSKDGLNYENDANWYYKTPANEKTGSLDIFLVYPTMVFDSQKGKYIDQNDEEVKAGVKEWVEKSIKPIFDGLNVNIYIPKYRQLNGAYYTHTTIQQTNYRITYQDIEQTPKYDIYNALDTYFKDYNKGDHVQFWGSSQGSALLELVASEFGKFYFKTQGAITKGFFTPSWALTSTILDNSDYKTATALQKEDKHSPEIFNWNTLLESEKTSSSFILGDGYQKGAINPNTFTTKGLENNNIIIPDSTQSLLTPKQLKISEQFNIPKGSFLDYIYFGPKLRENLIKGWDNLHIQDGTRDAFRFSKIQW